VSTKKHLVAGIHAVRTALSQGGDVVQLWYDPKKQEKRLAQLLENAIKAGVRPQSADRKSLEKMAQGAAHQGVIAEVRSPTSGGEKELDEILENYDGPPLLLILDNIQDPHNLGACLRTADAAGVTAVITPRDNSVGLTPVVCKVASGAAETVPFLQVTNLARTLKWLKKQWGVWLVGTSDQATQSLFDSDLSGPVGIVMGSEGSGLRRLVEQECDFLVSLPMAGVVESLNVSVATGVCLFEAVRQRRS
jgi:23S rRNA (guanosine2251-2'-O)-methyltransferase